MSDQNIAVDADNTFDNTAKVEAVSGQGLVTAPVSAPAFPIKAADLPTDQATIEEDTDGVLDDVEAQINAIIVLATVDPLALNEAGLPKFTEEQRELIFKAQETLAGWRD